MANVGEQGGVKFVTRFLSQETSGARGFNTCYPTSVVNASIALGVINGDKAKAAHEAIINDLIAIPGHWRGSELNISDTDEQLAQVIERHLPVRIGFHNRTQGRRLFLALRSHDSIVQSLLDHHETFVLPVRSRAHAYAIVGWSNKLESLVYIDPLDPFAHKFLNRERFEQNFAVASSGRVIVTPVRRI